MIGSTEKCRQCEYTGLVGREVVPYFVERRCVRQRRSRWVGPAPNAWVTDEAVYLVIHRWLCGLQTGRVCSVLWHQKYAAWLANKEAPRESIAT